MMLFHLLVFVFYGIVAGSFASAVIHRVGQGTSWIQSPDKKVARSRCPVCHNQLHVRDLIPVFSWIMLRGKCRYCHQTIAKQYILLEVGCGLLALLVYALGGFSVKSFILLALLPFIVAQTVLLLSKKRISLQLCVIIIVLGGGYLILPLFELQ